MKLLQSVFVVLLVLLVSTHALCQDSKYTAAEEENLANSLNLRLLTMQIALGEIRNLKSDLELVESQHQDLESLSKDYAKMVQSLTEMDKKNAGDLVALCLQKMKGFEDKLSSEILLPHQNSELRKMVFAKLLADNSDDWYATLSTYYPAEFKLTEDQKRKMKQIKSSATEEIAKAKKEFDEKLKKIRLAARDEIKDVLTPKQSKILSELTGHKN